MVAVIARPRLPTQQVRLMCKIECRALPTDRLVGAEAAGGSGGEHQPEDRAEVILLCLTLLAS